MIIPDSGSHGEQVQSADWKESELREKGWTPQARLAALAARKAHALGRAQAQLPAHVAPMIAARAAGHIPGLDQTFSSLNRKQLVAADRVTHNLVQTYGPEAGKQIRANLSYRIGVRTKTANVIRSTFFSNDGRHQYTGAVRGMRQKILSWAKANRRTLPSGFENRPPQAIAGMFQGMARGGYFGNKGGA